MLLVLAMSATMSGAQAPRASLALGPYVQPDGAITVFPDGRTVEPYFAIRALLAADALGLDVQPAATNWIRWQSERLRQDGKFARYCRQPGGAWSVCGAADADDAALAVWLQLLHAVPPAPSDVAGRRAMMRSADSALRALLDVGSGVYRVSPTLPVSLFMDNIEIANAFDAIAARQRTTGDARGAAVSRTRAAALRRAIDRVFWDSTARAYRITTQTIPAAPRVFYPDFVAEGYASFFGYGSPVEGAPVQFARWMTAYGSGWLGARDREYPWGLIAMAAERYGDRQSVECWLGQAISLRHGARWNVLEEAVLQGLLPVVGKGGAVPPCTRR
jgi:hypothetical protein